MRGLGCKKAQGYEKRNATAARSILVTCCRPRDDLRPFRVLALPSSTPTGARLESSWMLSVMPLHRGETVTDSTGS